MSVEQERDDLDPTSTAPATAVAGGAGGAGGAGDDDHEDELEDAEFDDGFEDDDEDDIDGNVRDAETDQVDDDDDDEIGAEGNRVVGGRPRAVVAYVARQLAEEPDAIDVEIQERRGEVVLVINAAPSDVGRLIGRRGRVIQALRQVARAAGAAEGVRTTVDVAE